MSLDLKSIWSHRPLQDRLAILVAVAVASAVAITGLSAYLITTWQVYAQLDTELLAIADVTSKWIIEDTDSQGSPDTQAMKSAGVSVLLVPAEDAQRVPSKRTTQLVPNFHDISVARRQQGYYARTDIDTSGMRQRIVTVPLNAEGTNYALLVGKSLQATENILNSLSLALIGFGLTGAMTAGAIGGAISRSGIAPVRKLTDAVTRITETDELTEIEVRGIDEVAELTNAFNSMLASLSSSRERQRRLIADAGHELRTPLTSMRTNIELLVADDQQGMLPEGVRGEILRDVAGQLGEFTTLVGDLVQLSREDRLDPAPEPIDLKNIVESAIIRAKRRGREITFDVELDSLFLVGEPDTLERAITNLLDNAVKFSPENGVIKVQLKGDRLTIADQGPGIASEDLPHVFDRFFRSESSRNKPGSGLGLSIVAQTIKAHGGWVRAGKSDLGGAVFTIRLPGSVQELESDDTTILKRITD